MASSYVVTTADDIVDASDNLLSLRESLAEAIVWGDRIEFDPSLKDAVLSISTTFTIGSVANVTIDGDIDNDGAADITVYGDGATIFRINESAAATFEYLKFGGRSAVSAGLNGSDGSAGSEGAAGAAGQAGTIAAGGDGGAGANGSDGGDGQDGGNGEDGNDIVGAIDNYGTATIRFVIFSGFALTGQHGGSGGNGGRGGDGGAGGAGGAGMPGTNSSGDGGQGGTGGDAGANGDGGNGGGGGDAAIISNHGTMFIGVSSFTNSSILGGSGGPGGHAGNIDMGRGGNGGDGGRAGAVSIPQSEFPGIGGVGGNGGNGGDGGRGGDAGTTGSASAITQHVGARLTFSEAVVYAGVSSFASNVSSGGGTGIAWYSQGGMWGLGGFHSIMPIRAANGLGGISGQPPTIGATGVAGTATGQTRDLGLNNLFGRELQTQNELYYIGTRAVAFEETGDSGSTVLSVQINRLGAGSTAATVVLTIHHPSNASGLNAAQIAGGLKPTSVTLNFAAGELSQRFLLSTLNDNFTTGDKYFDVTITSVTGSTPSQWSTASTRVSLLDDDHGKPSGDVLNGSPYADIIDGDGGGDSMSGGLGDDTYIVDSTGDIVSEVENSGIETVYASITYALPANVENLVLTGSASLSGTGNDLDNSISGNEGENVLNGGGGVDTLTGGLGNDTYVNPTGEVVVELAGGGTDTIRTSAHFNLVNLAEVENIELTGLLNYNAVGNASGNRLTGNDGNNRLRGEGGVDTLVGGLGNDTYVNPLGDTITELAGQGFDTVESDVTASISQLSQVEGILLTGAGNISATGNAGGNALTGNGGNNILNGSTGADTMAGGAGNDTYYVDAGGDQTVEAANAGIDLVICSISRTLSANVENLSLSGTAGNAGNGNELANVITGNGGANTMRGYDGSDTLIGNGGSDLLIGGLARDIVKPSVDANADTIKFASVAESSGITRDMVYDMDLNGEDRFDFPSVPSGLRATVSGTLNTTSFEANLAAAVGAAQLGSGQAVLFDPSSGNLNFANHLYLIVDANGVAGYQAGADYVVQLFNAIGTLTLDDFI